VRVLLTAYSCLAQGINSTLAYRIGGTPLGDDPATDLAGVEIRYLTETTPAAVVVARGEAAGQAAAQISKLVLSPNPASDELFLEAYFPDACEDAPAVADAFVYDAGGRLRMVRESLPCDGAAVRARLQVGELPAGVYWVQVVRGGVRVQGKLIKQP
ncbi:MAG: Secretion system C-terminal sorting domain, partial [Bacteroidota bacterium]